MNSLTWHPALPHWQMDQTIQGYAPFGPIDGSALIALVGFFGLGSMVRRSRAAERANAKTA